MSIKTIQDTTLNTADSPPLPTLPLSQDLETILVLKALKRASRALGELKGVATSMPNQAILI